MSNALEICNGIIPNVFHLDDNNSCQQNKSYTHVILYIYLQQPDKSVTAVCVNGSELDHVGGLYENENENTLHTWKTLYIKKRNSHAENKAMNLKEG